MIKHPHKIIFDKKAFNLAVQKASKILCDPVASTLGPDGLPVLIKQYEGKSPLLTKDGVTVADSIFCSDPLIDTIIQAIKEAARKTNTEAGDGTTSAIVITNALLAESFKYINSNAITPQQLKKEINKIKGFVFDQIDLNSIPVEDENLLDVAMVSANQDLSVAKAVVEGIEAAGEYGLVTIEEGYKSETEVVKTKGFHMDTGYQKLGPVGPALITHQEKQEIFYENAMILIYDGDFASEQSLAHFYNTFTNFGKNNKPLVLIAYSFSDIVLAMIANNRHMGVQIIPVVAPIYSSASVRRIYLDDFAAWCGAKTIDCTQDALNAALNIVSDKDKTYSLKDGFLGSCKKVSMKRDMTIFYQSEGKSDDKREIEKQQNILARVNGLKSLLEQTLVPYEQDVFKHRMAMLTNGVVNINVGGSTELEMKERKDRVIDAMNAVKAAIEKGIVPGGGTITMVLSDSLNELLKEDLTEETKIAIHIFKKALAAPLRQLAKNSARSEDVIEAKVRDLIRTNKLAGWGAINNKYEENMIKAGIVDPAKVTYCAIKNAVSIALELMTGGGGVVYSENETKEKPDIDGFYYNE